MKLEQKRKFIEMDLEIGAELPSAKRQHMAPTLFGGDPPSNVSSVASSLYISPIAVDESSTQELLSISSSRAEELSTASHSPLPDSPDSPDSTPSTGSGFTQKQPIVTHYAGLNYMPCVDYGYDEEEVEDDDEEEEEIDSSSTSPASTGSSAATNCSQNGERTPAQQQSLSLNIGCTVNSINNKSINNNNNNNNTKPKVRSLDDFMATNYKCMSPAVETSLRQCPLPALSWANAADVWKLMCQRDEEGARLRNSSMLEQHPGLQPRMRAILLDWLIEVCEVYKLHRETFYLAVDYLDRYLHVATKVQKTHLQLIGITCLFVAAKVEEIYPPKIGEFAYVTDGACTEQDILNNEKLLLQALGWDISPITVAGWLGIYMQLNVNNRTPASFAQIGRQAHGGASTSSSSTPVADDFIYPQFSAYEFVQTAQLLDLCTLDVCMANYSYSVLAAAAMSHTFSRETALRSSGLDWQIIQPCARWMEPFYHVICKSAPYLHVNEQNEQVTNRFGLAHVCPNIVTDDSHIIQTHTTTMDMYDELLMVQNNLHAMRARTQASPATGLRAPENLLTPPASSHKADDFLADEEEAPADSSSIANRENVALAVNSSGKDNCNRK